MSYINERTFLTGHLLLDPEATRNLLLGRAIPLLRDLIRC